MAETKYSEFPSEWGPPPRKSNNRRFFIFLGCIVGPLLLFGLATGTLPQAPPPTAPEPKRTVPPELQKSALVVLRSRGYVCEQVRDSLLWLSEPGFTLYCPRWKFEFYENGGRWKIVPKQYW